MRKRILIYIGIAVMGLAVMALIGLPYTQLDMASAQYTGGDTTVSDDDDDDKREDDGPGEGFDHYRGGEAGVQLGNAAAAAVGGDGRRLATAGCLLYDAPNGNVTPGQIGEAPLVGLNIDRTWYLIRVGGQQGVWVSASCAR